MSGRGLQNPFNRRAEAEWGWKVNRWLIMFLLVVLSIVLLVKGVQFLLGLFV